MSWPSDTTFNPSESDPAAMCRCETEVDPDRLEPTDFEWGEGCGSLDADQCGDVDCEICTFSWPDDSPYLDPASQDPYAMCRCQQERQPTPDPSCTSWAITEDGVEKTLYVLPSTDIGASPSVVDNELQYGSE